MFYPIFWEQAQEMVAAALFGGSCGDYTGAGRRVEGAHSDPTMMRALRLLEARELQEQLALVRRWVDCELRPEDRPLVLAVWRVGWLGWRTVGRELGLPGWWCRSRFDELTQQLFSWLAWPTPPKELPMARSRDGEALCWHCQRAGWTCLCTWPHDVMPGSYIEERRDGGGTVRVLVGCRFYWPELQDQVRVFRRLLPDGYKNEKCEGE